MYCSGCGTQIQSGLNYCSRCGKRVVETDLSAKPASSEFAAIAATVGGIGFGAYIFVVLILAKSGLPASLFVPITVFYFAALFGICYILLRQGSTPRAGKGEEKAAEPVPDLYLRPAATAQLPEAHVRPASVTEHTTRTLDGVPIER